MKKPMIKAPMYDTFRCTADQCTFHCCREWRITVDEKTLEKWQHVTLDGQSEPIHHYAKKEEEGYLLSLEKDGCCPFLNEKGLCKVVLQAGEEYLSDTCTRFPRQINHYTEWDEYTLDMGCPAVIDLFYKETQPVTFVAQEITAGHQQDYWYQLRQMLMGIIETRNLSIPKRLMIGFFALLELQEVATQKEQLNRMKAYADTSYLQHLAKEIDRMHFQPIDSLWERNELLQDVLQCYLRDEMYGMFINPLADFASSLETRYSDEELGQSVHTFEEVYSEYEVLLTNYLLTEVFANCLKEEMDLETVIMVYEWICLEYGVLKQAVYLQWLEKGCGAISYEVLRDYIMIIARIAGYSQQDIKEYLADSFEEPIFEWGYLALVVGNNKI